MIEFHAGFDVSTDAHETQELDDESGIVPAPQTEQDVFEKVLGFQGENVPFEQVRDCDSD